MCPTFKTMLQAFIPATGRAIQGATWRFFRSQGMASGLIHGKWRWNAWKIGRYPLVIYYIAIEKSVEKHTHQEFDCDSWGWCESFSNFHCESPPRVCSIQWACDPVVDHFVHWKLRNLIHSAVGFLRYTYTHTHTYICIYILVYIYTYIYICINIDIYIHISCQEYHYINTPFYTTTFEQVPKTCHI